MTQYTDDHNYQRLEREIAAAALIPTIKVLLSKLFSFSSPLLMTFKEDFRSLRWRVALIQRFLHDAEIRAIFFIDWLQDLEAVAFDADNLLDELNYHALRQKVEEDNKMKNIVADFFSFPFFKHKMGKKIQRITKELEYIDKKAIELGLQITAGTVAHARSSTCEMKHLDSAFVGRENDVAKIVDTVTSSSIEEQAIFVLPIVGMGGVGKTALAEAVYNDKRISDHFEERIWVHVSENFDLDTVLNDILHNLMMGMNLPSLSDRRVVKHYIRKNLSSKKYFLVLDNVWNEDFLKWEDFIKSMLKVSSRKGNVIILTSRKDTSVHSFPNENPFYNHKLGGLSDEDCWLIIRKRTKFQGEHPHLEAIGKRIAKKCGGLPLAAHVVGCLLIMNDRLEEVWLSIERWCSNLGGYANPMSEVLKLSFDNLPSPTHKKCFAYSALFIPKGSSVEKDELIELWMAEGLLQADKHDDIEIVGHNVLKVLIQSSMLHVRKRDLYGDVKILGMHDLMNDLAFSILCPNKQQLRYISPRYFHQGGEYESLPRIEFKKSEYMRTLLLRDDKYFSHNMLSMFECLHSLILAGEDIKELPNLIGTTLIHLKYLDISLTSIESLPESIGQLYLFQTLRATNKQGGESYLRRLPVALKYMISLRHLHIPNIQLPPNVGKLTSLQTLPYFHVSDEEGRRIVELGKLTNLRGELEITNLEKVRDKEEAMGADLLNKQHISMLKLVWKDISDTSREKDESVLEGLQPHPNLEKLEIDGFRGKSFPLWTIRMTVGDDQGLNNLIELRFSNCIECEEIPMLGQLSHLKYLYLTNLTNVSSIGSSFYGINGGNDNDNDNDTTVVFPKLQRLELIGLEKLTVWEEVNASSSISVFPCLEVLVIKKCRLLQSAPSHFTCLKDLEIHDVCYEITNEDDDQLTNTITQ